MLTLLTPTPDDVARFWSKVSVPACSSCWLWTASTDRYGYGKLRYRGLTVKAHRMAWFITNGLWLPPETFLLHQCDVRTCVAPHHLRPGSNTDNVRDAIAKGRHFMPWAPKVVAS